MTTWIGWDPAGGEPRPAFFDIAEGHTRDDALVYAFLAPEPPPVGCEACRRLGRCRRQDFSLCLGWMPKPTESYPLGVPCNHPGCLNHITHPCEGCGRYGGMSWLPMAAALHLIFDHNSRPEPMANIGVPELIGWRNTLAGLGIRLDGLWCITLLGPQPTLETCPISLV